MVNLAAHVPVELKRRIVTALPPVLWRTMRVYVHGQSRMQLQYRRARLRRMRRLVAPAFGKGLVPIEYGGSRYLARVVTSFRSAEVLAHHLAMVADCLAAHGIEFAVLDAQIQRPRVVIVPRSQRAAALQALRSDLSGSATYSCKVRNDKLTRTALVDEATPRRTSVARYFQVFASASGVFLGGPDLGCDVEFWAETDHDSPATENGEPIEAGSLIAPRRNRWADVIGPRDRHPTTSLVDGVRRPVLTAATRRHLFSMTEPIDVVYTWVDGSDPEWLARKSATLQAADINVDLHVTASNDSRFESRDELRYSMRSLDMYADWVRHVYLVTDDQVPTWLDTNNPRLTIVSHRELFGDRGRLPTFNSHAIETQLHRIEGLSEHYLYLNDDVFFGRPVSPEAFFHANGLSKFFLSHAKIGLGQAAPGDMPVMSAAKNNRDLINKLFDGSVSNKFKHVPHPQRRSVVLDMERDFAAEFERTASSQFRHPDDVSVAAALHHYYGFATGRAVPAAIRYFYADIARTDTPTRLENLLRQRNYDVFCLNDHDSSRVDPVEQAQMMRDFLIQYLPLPSCFEK